MTPPADPHYRHRFPAEIISHAVRYIQQRAANHDGRIVTSGQLIRFSTETGDVWLLDRTDLLAARLPEMAKLHRSRSWKPRPRLLSNGRAAKQKAVSKSLTRSAEP